MSSNHIIEMLSKRFAERCTTVNFPIQFRTCEMKSIQVILLARRNWNTVGSLMKWNIRRRNSRSRSRSRSKSRSRSRKKTLVDLEEEVDYSNILLKCIVVIIRGILIKSWILPVRKYISWTRYQKDNICVGLYLTENMARPN